MHDEASFSGSSPASSTEQIGSDTGLISNAGSDWKCFWKTELNFLLLTLLFLWHVDVIYVVKSASRQFPQVEITIVKLQMILILIWRYYFKGYAGDCIPRCLLASCNLRNSRVTVYWVSIKLCFHSILDVLFEHTSCCIWRIQLWVTSLGVLIGEI